MSVAFPIGGPATGTLHEARATIGKGAGIARIMQDTEGKPPTQSSVHQTSPQWGPLIGRVGNEPLRLKYFTTSIAEPTCREGLEKQPDRFLHVLIWIEYDLTGWRVDTHGPMPVARRRVCIYLGGRMPSNPLRAYILTHTFIGVVLCHILIVCDELQSPFPLRLPGGCLPRSDRSGPHAALCQGRAAQRCGHCCGGADDQPARHPYTAPLGIPGSGHRGRGGDRP